jgi:hypothetical protein
MKSAFCPQLFIIIPPEGGKLSKLSGVVGYWVTALASCVMKISSLPGLTRAFERDVGARVGHQKRDSDNRWDERDTRESDE